MKIYSNISLKNYNTFAIDVKAHKLIEIENKNELFNFLDSDFKIIGEGSNILLTKNIEIPILKLNFKGISIKKQTKDFVWIEALSGENWHNFVMYCIKNQYGGVENLSLIPGKVGTSPIQNIGAYGTEVKNIIEECEVIDCQEKKLKILNNSQCQFGYRDSIFKKEKNRYIITAVTFRLTKNNHQLNTKYGDIEKYLSEKRITHPSIADISQAIIQIRKNKLPDPKIWGNSGSFFKNPIINLNLWKKIQEKYPQAPHYLIDENQIKIPAGWLIETCNLKGFRKGDAGVHKNQALVLINYGNASGVDIYNLSKLIQDKIYNTFTINLETEVNIW